MKILEITRPSTMSQAKQVLVRAGYDQIGDGRYALVFQKYGDPYVLKLFSNKDVGYPWFYKYVAANPSQNFPKFKGVLIQITDAYSAIRMEPLSELPNEETGDRIEAVLDEISYAAEKGRPLYDAETHLMIDSDFIKTATKLARNAIASGFTLDLTRYNVMMRGMIYIITDPVTNHND